MSEEKRMLGNYEVVNSIYIGDKEVVFGVDKSDKYPFLVSYCDYHNPFGVPWATESVGCDDYLEAMGIFIQRVQSQIEQTKSELSKFAFDNTVFTKDHCIPDKRSSSIVGKVVVINAEPKRYEYQHPAFQLVLADGGNGATGGRAGSTEASHSFDLHKPVPDRALSDQRGFCGQAIFAPLDFLRGEYHAGH